MPKPLPDGEQLWDFSYSRSKGKFRWRLGDDFWLCDAIAGDAFIVGCNNDTGNIGIFCRLIEQGGTFFSYLDSQDVAETLTMQDLPKLPKLPSNGAVMHPETHNELDDHVQAGYLPEQLYDYHEIPDEERHWRLCYHRAGTDWRVRDERAGRLWLVEGYHGPVKMSWLDGGTHIFHDGKIEVDEDRIAHFVSVGGS